MDTSLRLIIESSYIQTQAVNPLQGFCQQKLADMGRLYEQSVHFKNNRSKQVMERFSKDP
ncbi:hypothetical protein GCM10025794_27620 [Massilia kyonggiensis]